MDSVTTVQVAVQSAGGKPQPEAPADAVYSWELTEKEQQAADAVSANWPFPKERDGWCRIHAALRKGLADFIEAASICKNRLAVEESIEPWMAKTLLDYYTYFSGVLHHHHDSEEEIAFPFMEKKVKSLPPRFSSDHKEILALTDSVKSDLEKLALANDKEQVGIMERIVGNAKRLEGVNQEHFKEEEDKALTLLRHYYTEKEFAPCLKKILAKQTTVDLGFLLNAFDTKEEQVAWCREIAHIPGPVISLVIMPGLKKYRRDYADPLQDVILGEQRPKPSSCCFGC